MELKELLNEEQYNAATTIEGPLLILAGAGSGKTRTITYRIAHMIKDLNINSYQILAITFTNKAAKEMKDRVRSLIGIVADNMWISTFHSLCVRILRREIEKLGYTNSFTIYDFYDQKALVKQCMEILKVNSDNIDVAEIIKKISKYKNDFIKPSEALSMDLNYREKIIADVYELYEKKLFENNSLDFDNLIFKTIEIFEKYPDVLAFYQSKFKYIMVDEYQDTNYSQYYLVKLLASKYKNICVVGDDDQCIYQWRGADINNILDFEKDYKDTKIIKLDKNYRSKSNILNAANKVISNNLKRKDKVLRPVNSEGEKIKVFKASDAEQEVLFVINEILRMIKYKGYEYRDFGILYRTNSQSRIFEEMFVKNNIPYKLIGVVRFYERKEIKDIVAYLKTIVNPSDEISLRRIVNEPKRGIGDVTVDKLLEYAEQNSITLFDAMEACGEITTITVRTANVIKSFVEMILDLRKNMDVRPSEFIKLMIEKIGYKEFLSNSKDPEVQTRLENIEEFVNAAVNFENLNQDATLNDFLENILLISEVDKYDEQSSSVTLMTLHSSKGLEFPVVFMVGMENGLFPSNKCFDEPEEMEESRRLCYVGITRAKDILYLTYANLRTVYGESSFRTKSKFLMEVPRDLIVNVGIGGEEKEPHKEETFGKYGKLSYGYSLNKQQEIKNDISREQVSVGKKIKHKTFGEGMIVKIEDDDKSTKIFVAFNNNGVKKLDLDKSPIEFI